MPPKPTDPDLRGILADTATIAVVGASADHRRPSYEVYRYLVACRYRVYPVNPTITEIDGAPVYGRLADLPVIPDLVDVFRRREALGAVLADTLRLAPHPRTLWLQLGLADEQIAERAEAAGIRVVMDRCLKVEHARLFSGC